MFTAVLIAPPNTETLSHKIVETTHAKLKGGDIKWLSTDEACEFEIGRMPQDGDACIWQAMQTEDIDIAIVPTQGRRKKVLLADMDSTMIEQECIDELADLAGHGTRVKEITARAMNGEIEFEDALRARVGLFEGVDVDVIKKVIEERITFMPGGKILLSTMKSSGAFTALVSSGFTDFTAHVSAMLGFDEHRANVLLQEDGKLTGKPGTPILGQQAKVDAMDEITKNLALADDDVLAVGDGANDLPMITRAGLGVALHAKPNVQKHAKVKLNFADLTGLLYLQGYTKSEFTN
ncbi:MAG: phosphoserine phosphatase SerB [Pseudomonadota bacterium]